jgi:PKHD-type hydroxylase
MLVQIADVLTPDEIAHCRASLDASSWVDGKATAGTQSALAKNNLQIPEMAPVARELGDIILSRLGQNAEFLSAALPLRVVPPLFNRYDVGMGFGDHIDNAIRFVDSGKTRVRTDLSCTLFLSEPEEYDGGELIIADTFGTQSVKLPAGHMVVYPGSSVHRVSAITRGSRWASFFWVQSMVKDDGQRALLQGLDQSIMQARADLSDDHAAVIGLTATYHNLIRMWSEL